MIKKNKESGFSFFELMAVVAIIGIMSVVAIPNLIAWRNNSMVRGAAFNLRSDMQMAKLRAIRSGNTNVAIAFSADSYQIFLDSGNDYNISGDTIIASRTVSGATFSPSFGGEAITAFNSKGQATRAGSVTISNGHTTIVANLSSIGLISM